jgi:hypothetical protein
VPFPAGLGLGAHTVSVTQAVDGVTSPPAVVSFTIHAPVPAAFAQSPAPAEAPAAAVQAAPTQPTAAVPPSQGAVTPAGDTAAVVRSPVENPAENLAATGAGGLLLAAALAGLALVAGGVLLALSRRRKRARATNR